MDVNEYIAYLFKDEFRDGETTFSVIAIEKHKLSIFHNRVVSLRDLVPVR